MRDTIKLLESTPTSYTAGYRNPETGLVTEAGFGILLYSTAIVTKLLVAAPI